MIRLLTGILLLTSLNLFGQNNQYTVSSYLTEGTKAPNTHYLGEAWLNRLVSADGDLIYNITKATFRMQKNMFACFGRLPGSYINAFEHQSRAQTKITKAISNM